MTSTIVALAMIASTVFGQGVPDDVETYEPGVLVRAPVSQEAYSWDLTARGLQNGRIPSSALITVSGCQLERDAAYTMSTMIEAAAGDGVNINPVWCYRSISQQHSTYSANCPLIETTVAVLDPVTGLPMIAEDGTPVVSVLPSVRQCSVPTASPSRSNHGWGRAVDFVVGGRSMGCGDAAFRWLQSNASQFGWTHPDWAQCNRATREPWHWEYGGLQLLPFPSVLAPDPIVPPENME